MSGGLYTAVAIPVGVKCLCRHAPRRISVSLDADFWTTMRVLLQNAVIPKDQRVFDVYCTRCSSAHPVTVGDLELDRLPPTHHM